MDPSLYTALHWVLFLAVLLMSVVTHEFFHGWTAWKFGDATAKNEGRLSFNPLVHIDPFMTVILPIMTMATMGFPFGGAKPVPVNPFMLTARNNMLVSLAGPASNFGLAALSFILMVVLQSLVPIDSLGFLVLFYGLMLNVLLGVFNLLPIPPLDGSHVLVYFVPQLEEPFRKIGFGGIILIILVIYSGALHLVLDPVRTFIYKALAWAYGLGIF
ncbi:MAG: site-2 protease family protein [Planctomycetota bacterium]|jgi:Zn-dependent protease